MRTDRAVRYLCSTSANGQLVLERWGPPQEVAVAGGDVDHVRLNRAGAAVCVTVNATDGRGRSRENVTGVGAVFVDLDGAPLEPVLTCASESLLASLAVSTFRRAAMNHLEECKKAPVAAKKRPWGTDTMNDVPYLKTARKGRPIQPQFPLPSVTSATLRAPSTAMAPGGT